VYTIAPAPLATNDNEAAIDPTTVSLTINGIAITPVPDSTVQNGYKQSINFNDTTIFPQAPSGPVPVVIKATNKRTPKAVEGTNSYFFTLDGSGPIVTIKSHKDQDIIGGQVKLGFNVTDTLSSVDQKTVTVTLNQDVHLYDPTDTAWTYSGGDYTYTFDSANISGSKVQVTVNVTASDIAGNKSPGDSVILYLDNYPPIIDMDPGNVRTRKKTTVVYCSASFDPLGTTGSTADLATVKSFAQIRALVWDRFNFIAGQQVFYLSGTNPSSVYLYLQPDGPTMPLLINNDSDPECDALATTSNGKPLPSLHLNPVPPQGSAWYFDDGATNTPSTVGANPPCIMGLESAPQHLCTNQVSDLTTVIRHDAAGIEPVIYGIGSMTGLECTGGGWELSSQLANATQKEGWFCLAISASDNVGNKSISRPLRVCYDDPSTSFVPNCAPSGAPSCTDGCTPPAGFPATILGVH
jgi:hypothetical protein